MPATLRGFLTLDDPAAAAALYDDIAKLQATAALSPEILNILNDLKIAIESFKDKKVPKISVSIGTVE